MRLHRFIGGFNLNQKNIEVKDAELTHQLKKVMRFVTGDKVILCDGASNEARATIINFTKDSVSFKILETYKNESESETKVTLFLSILKRENFELAVQKAIEIGIFEIFPITTTRTVKTGLNMERLHKIAREASEQSGRGIIPHIHEPINFESAIEKAKQNDLNILFDPSGILIENLKLKIENSHKGSAFVGPEGGFTKEEIKMARENNFEITSLGKLILRAETASIVASYLSVKN